jgi:hypothetical protein
MRVWVICFVVFFSVAETYQWVRGLTLPLPVFMVLGGLLAIASNSDKWGLLPHSSRLPKEKLKVNATTPIAAVPAPPIAADMTEKVGNVSFLIPKRKGAMAAKAVNNQASAQKEA